MLAVSAFSLFGMVALATEAGTWYLLRARAQDAADAAAWAAVLANASGADPTAAAQYVAVQNGFSSGNVVVSCFVSSCSSSASAEYQVTVSAQATAYLSSLFVSAAPTIQARSVAGLSSTCSSSVACGCMLSTAGDLSISKNFSGTGCIVGSNAPDPTAIGVSGTTTVSAYGLTTTGDCSASGCANSGVSLKRAYASYQPATTDTTYTAMDNAAAGWTLPACGTITPTYSGSAFSPSAVSTGSTTITVASGGASVPLNEILVIRSGTSPTSTIPGGTYATAHTATKITLNNPVTLATTDSIQAVSAVAMLPGLYAASSTCAGDGSYLSGTTSPTFVVAGSGTTWTLTAGTYFFSSVSLAIVSGTVKCLSGVRTCSGGTSGLTILLTGDNSSDPVGNLYICNSASGSCTGATAAIFSSSSINAQPSVTVGGTSLNGVMFYRVRGSAGTASMPAVWIWGYYTSASTNTVMNGAMYFPGAYVSFGNPGISSTCAAVIAGYLSLTGTTTTTATTFCPNYGVTLAQPLSARMLE
jgi:hypothetical protein